MADKSIAAARDETAARRDPEVQGKTRPLVAEQVPELIDKSWARKNRAPTASLEYRDEGLALNVSRAQDVSDKAAALIFHGSLGTTDPAFGDALVDQLVNVTSVKRKADPKAFGFAMAVVQGIEPRDEIEAMLATQMAAVHMATVTMARRLANADLLPQQDSAERAFNKLARTFAVQVEALKRYRTGGEQKVTVQHQHVTVNDGGQAVVGSVTHGGRGGVESER